ncbi:interferon alpha-inducible protein 27-like protein 2 isoform X2 [Thunnus thynnus]|uniref:interferon alpha-inducible protein 27-like protein 2 isoform X2 n=1 Tax=Thunnus thynnus TaxID=8237 RepID=UPI0035274644
MDTEEFCKALVIGGGFTSTGIAASSLAAKMMAYYAAANGGGVLSGGLVAILQSLGAAGLSGSGTVLTAGAGGVAGWLISAICNKTVTT